MRREGSLTAITRASWLLLDGHEVVAEHQLHGHGAQQVVLNLEILQINEFGAIARCQGLCLGALVEAAYHRPSGRRDCCVSHI